jgi:2-haloacid dehalogenase
MEYSSPASKMPTDLDLTKFKALSFDCYGTLIDWESGLLAVLSPWAREQRPDVADEGLLLAFADNEGAVQLETPSALYPDVLATAFRRTGEQLGTPVSDEWAQRLGGSVPDWPAFPDSPDALARLARRYKLIILSNVHRAGFAASNERLRGDFAAIITAEDVGAYKPAENHFRALDAALPGLGVERSKLLHVAQSLFHDHVPAKREGLPSVWINRRHDRPGWGATQEPTDEWSFNLEFRSMKDFADAVDQAFNDAPS